MVELCMTPQPPADGIADDGAEPQGEEGGADGVVGVAEGGAQGADEGCTGQGGGNGCQCHHR